MPVPAPPKWHPILALHEDEPAHWELFDQFQKKYADIRLVRRDGELGYRTLAMRVQSTAPIDLGILPTLRAAVEAAHKQWIASHGHNGKPNPNWGQR